MSVDTVRMTPDGGLILDDGERVLYSQKSVRLTMKNSGKEFKDIDGIAYISHQRIVFSASNPGKFSTINMPRKCIKELDVQQPIFGSNFVSFKLEPEVDGGLEKTVETKMDFKAGGAIEFAKAANVAFRQAAISGHVRQQQGHGPPMPAGVGPIAPGMAPPGYAAQSVQYPYPSGGYPPQHGQQFSRPGQQGPPNQAQQTYPEAYPERQQLYQPQVQHGGEQAPPMSYEQTQAQFPAPISPAGYSSIGASPPDYRNATAPNGSKAAEAGC
eukprot:CFRG3481T1